jgi:hypothetical protein
MAAGARPPEAQWSFGSYVFEYRKGGPKGIGILTVKGKKVGALAFHMVAGTMAGARKMAGDAMNAFEQGKIPDEGVFRMEALAKSSPETIAALIRGERAPSSLRFVIRKRIQVTR